LKELGEWPAADGGIKKKKKPAGTPDALPVGGGSNVPSSPLPSSSTRSSAPAQAASLAAALSLGPPEWRFSPPQLDAPHFHTVACFFANGGAHAGPIGEVRNVLGKKKAKEECARLTVAYLEEVRRYRVECGRRVLEGVVGGEGVVDAAVGRGWDGEGVKKEEDVDSEFEDAMEELV